MKKRGKQGLVFVAMAVLAFLGPQQAVEAQGSRAPRINNQIAVFAALDKVTARVSKLEIRIGETARFRAFKVTPRVCHTREPTDPPETTSFVEIDKILLNGEEQRVFTGWMLAESPGLHAVEDPVLDVWLTSCKMPSGGVSTGSR